MADFEGSLALAKEKLKQADHMVCVTYPLIKEPKLLLSSLENMYLGVSAAMRALLLFERSRRRVPLFSDSFASQYALFATRVVPQYKLNKKYVQFIAHLKEYLDHHKKAGVEFRHNGSLVIADDDYELKTLTSEVIKEQLAFAKMFISEISLLILQEKEHELEGPKKQSVHVELVHDRISR
jgi:hypothetical protein